MTVCDMKMILNRWGIPAHWYNVGSYLECAYCLEVDHDHWIIYVGENGRKSMVFMFQSENDACRVLSNFLLCKLRLLKKKKQKIELPDNLSGSR